jgi:hypothetical protein
MLAKYVFGAESSHIKIVIFPPVLSLGFREYNKFHLRM